MRMILDEYEYAQKMIKEKRFLDKPMSSCDINILARYYRWYEGLTGIKLKKEIIDFCEKATNIYNDISYESRIEYACNLSKRLKLRLPKSVFLTQTEIDIIKNIDSSENIKKTLFGMLCLSKYYKVTSIKVLRTENENASDRLYYNRPISDVLTLMKIRLNKAQRYGLMYELQHSNLVNAKYNGNYEMLFYDKIGEQQYEIKYIEDILMYYEIIIKNKDNLTLCSKCGRPMFVYNTHKNRQCVEPVCKECKI